MAQATSLRSDLVTYAQKSAAVLLALIELVPVVPWCSSLLLPYLASPQTPSKKPFKRLKAREAAVQDSDEEEQTSPELFSQDEDTDSEKQVDVIPEDELDSSEDDSFGTALGAMAMLVSESDEPQACATKTGRTPMFLDAAGKAYALADSGATNITLNLKHLPEHLKSETTPASMVLASGQVESETTPASMVLASGQVAFLLLDEVYASDVKAPLCPLRRLTMKLDIAIEWTKDHCVLALQGVPLTRLILKKVFIILPRLSSS
eukprot:880850-Amphidinium_carterae.2